MKAMNCFICGKPIKTLYASAMHSSGERVIVGLECYYIIKPCGLRVSGKGRVFKLPCTPEEMLIH